jgi:tight adherence protein C
MDSGLLDINFLVLFLVAAMALLGLYLAVYGVFSWSKREKQKTSRLEHFVSSQDQVTGDSKESHIIPREIRGSLFSRTIAKWIRKLLNFLGRFTPERMIGETEHKLTIAGHPYNLHAREFFAIRILLFVGCVVLAYLANKDFGAVDKTSLLLGFGTVFVGLMLPNYWLKKQVSSRQEEILRSLPDVLDMLSVCASAGLGFEQSLQKISTYWDTELGLEFRRVVSEMEMGVSRVTALRSMSTRLAVEDLSRFISLIIQAEKVGMSYADVLHSQAIQMRVQRQYRAKEIANKLPGKIIIPVALLIFPAIIAVILGPAIPTLLNAF